jgi:hypothetical protein
MFERVPLPSALKTSLRLNCASRLHAEAVKAAPTVSSDDTFGYYYQH